MGIRRCWRLGSHRLVCGDALDPAVVAALMDGEKAEMVFTDPPYNVSIEGNVSGLGKVRHREFAMASGELSRLLHQLTALTRVAGSISKTSPPLEKQSDRTRRVWKKFGSSIIIRCSYRLTRKM